MKFWNTADGLDGVRDDIRQIHDLISASFNARGEEMPRMLAVATCETDADAHVYEAFFELAPGVVLSTGYGSPEDIEGDEFPKWKAPGAAEEAEFSINAYLAMGVDRLSNLLHDLRLRARKIIAKHAGGEGSARLSHIRLTDQGPFTPGKAQLKVRLEGLDAQLRPKAHELRIDHPDNFDVQILRWSETMAARYAAHRLLGIEGASGSIDLLTLNAVSTFAEPQAWIRSLATSGWPASPLHVTVFADNGEFRSHGSDTASELVWNRDTVQYPAAVPATLLMAYTGRPITDMIEHPMLTREMTIIDATCGVDGKTPFLSVRIDQPRLLFCTGSGRTWRSDVAPR